MRGMAHPARLLGDGETLVHEFRPHGQALLWPAVALIATAFAASYLLTALDGSGPVPGGLQPAVRVLVVVGALAVVLFATLLPLARWLSIRYLITDRRLITRWGLLTREGRDLPLARLTDVRYTAGPLQWARARCSSRRWATPDHWSCAACPRSSPCSGSCSGCTSAGCTTPVAGPVPPR